MKLMKFLAKSRYRKGFTLTELIVVTAIIAIIMASIAAFAGPVRTLLRNASAKSDANTINKVMGDYIERRLAYANYLNIIVGAPSTSGTTLETLYPTAQAAYNDLKQRMEYDNDGKQKNYAGILYFHFIEDPVDHNKNTYKVYDYKISHSDMVPVNFAGLYAKVCTDDNALYVDDFYSGYEYYITMNDMTIAGNDLKRKAYLNFSIDAYNCEGLVEDPATGDGTAFTKQNIIDNYKYVDAKNSRVMSDNNVVNDITTDPMLPYTYEKIGTELVSFSLENISDPSLVTYTRGNELTTSKVFDYDTDIIIFYNVRTFRIGADQDITGP